MYSSQFYLFKDLRFLPIFLVQLFGCLNDSIIKNALIMLVMFKLSSNFPLPSYILVLLANILLVLPFVIFASIAGQVSDKYERAIVTRIIKISELVIVLFTMYGFYYEKISLLFVCLTALGIHSAFFGPIKYSVLPDQLDKNELLEANGYAVAGTFLAI